MRTVAYLANLFPAASERYVADEIQEVRRRGMTVIPCSCWRPKVGGDSDLRPWTTETVYLWPLRVGLVFQAAWLCLTRPYRLREFLSRILLHGTESAGKRMRAFAHTLLGAYYAAVLRKSHPQHIHVHHGYFGSWVAMAAACLLDIEFSMTLHGSDVLIDAAYLDLKLERCQLCVTISDFNRRYLLANHPNVDPRKVIVQRLGVECSGRTESIRQKRHQPSFAIFTAGRLHPVKDHAFLIRACRRLKTRGLKFTCLIAGDGPERRSLEAMIKDSGLQDEVRLLGQISHEHIPGYYTRADLVVLTSRSEGIPLVLMEAMVHQTLVLAPAITGIPELVSHGKTGFLYRPGSVNDFVAQVEMIHDTRCELDKVREAAHQHVVEHFDRQKNLESFCARLIAILEPSTAQTKYLHSQEVSHENPVLQ